MRFDDVFPLGNSTCAARQLQPFFGVFATFLASLAAGFGLRAFLEYLMATAISMVVGDDSEGGDSPPDFEGGTFEFQVVKTGFLGTCQAAGSLLLALQNEECQCGWLRPALTAMVVFWLLCIPLGLIVFLSYRYQRKVRSREIQFERDSAASFSTYVGRIWAAAPTPDTEPFAYPPVVHAFVKFLLAVGVAICSMMAIKASSAAYQDGETDVAKAIEAGVLWGATLLLYGAAVVGLKSAIGRRLVVGITNCLSAQKGKRYSIVDGGEVVAVESRRFGLLGRSF